MSAPPEFIHRFIPGHSARTLLLLHGTGGTEADLLDLGRALDPQAALLSPRGQVLENGMPRFFRRLAEGVFDEEDVRRRAHDLNDFIVAASQRYEIERHQIIAVGFSNGANIAGALLLLRPEIFSAAILFRPMLPLVPEMPPSLGDIPIFISSGQHDPIVPLANVRSLVALLEKSGARVHFEMSNASHGLTDSDVAAARRWLAAI